MAEVNDLISSIHSFITGGMAQRAAAKPPDGRTTSVVPPAATPVAPPSRLLPQIPQSPIAAGPGSPAPKPQPEPAAQSTPAPTPLSRLNLGPVEYHPAVGLHVKVR